MNTLIPGTLPDEALAGYHELDYIELRLRRAKRDDELRSVVASLNRYHHDQYGSSAPASRARYATLRGVTYLRGAVITTGTWLGNSSVESLIYAIEQFVDAEETLKRLASDEQTLTLPNHLADLRRTAAYEAGVAVTHLRMRGVPLTDLPKTPDTGCLSARDQNTIMKALQHSHSISSRF